MNKSQEIIHKHDLKPHSYYTESPYKNRELYPKTNWDDMLFEKWKNNIPDDWYGFCLGPLPDKCCRALDEMLEYAKSVEPQFEIHQIKVKFTQVRCYMGNISTDLYKQFEELADAMEDKFLRY